MDFIGRGAWRPLVVVFGLIFSPSVFATDSDAINACFADRTYWTSIGQNWVDGSPSDRCVQAVPSCEVRTVNLPGVGQRTGVALHVTWGYAPNCSSQGSDVSYSIGSPGASGSGFTRSGLGPGAGYFYWSDERDPDPEPDECASASPYTLTIPDGGTVGGGFYNVCTAGCSFTGKMGYVGTYPAGNVVVNYTPTGSSCVPPDDEDPEPDLPSDDPLDLPPEDGGVDPGYDPGDGTPGSSGGSTCAQAPSCTGDSLQCNILFQQWMTRCDAEQISTDASGQRDEIIEGLIGVRDGVGGLADGIDRIGDGVDGLAGGIDRIGDGIDDVNGKLDGTNQRLDIIGGSLDGIADGVDGLGSRFGDVFGDGPVGDDWLGGMTTRDVVLDSSKLDDSGMGLSRTCPAVLTNSTSFSFFGNSYTLKFEMFCAMLELVGQLLVVLAAFVGVRILLKSTTG